MPNLCTGDEALGGVSIDTSEGDMMDRAFWWDLSDGVGWTRWIVEA